MPSSKSSPKSGVKRSPKADRPSADADARVARGTQGLVQEQRRIQSDQDARNASARRTKGGGKGGKGKGGAKAASAVQAGWRLQPRDLPAEHLAKPGLEAEMSLTPNSDAPYYRGSGKLDGMVALITGGDSGIGRAVAVLFAREGADVAIVHLAEDQDARDTQALIEREGRRALTLRGDVRDPAFCRKAVKKVVKAFGALDVLVNNAAFQMHADAIEDITDERFDMTMRTNVYGYFQMARAALPHLRERGSIVNSGSVTGLRGSASLIDYSTTKGAIHAFTKALASQVLPRGIRVNAVAPGPVWTPLNPADKPPEDVAHFGQGTDMGRVAQPEELAPAYVFLASPAMASYITGIVLPVTGSVGEH